MICRRKLLRNIANILCNENIRKNIKLYCTVIQKGWYLKFWIHIFPNGILYLQYSTVYLFSCLRKCRYSVDLCLLLLTSEYMHRPYLRLFHVPHDSVKIKEDFLKETVSQNFLFHFLSSFLFFRVFRNPYRSISKFYWKAPKIFISQGWPPMSNDTVAKFIAPY